MSQLTDSGCIRAYLIGSKGLNDSLKMLVSLCQEPVAMPSPFLECSRVAQEFGCGRVRPRVRVSGPVALGNFFDVVYFRLCLMW
jgi:hypothetical protein